MRCIVVIALLKLAQCILAEPCKVPETAKEVDWSKMGGIWYDVIDMPAPPTAVDLFDWHDIVVTDRGFSALINEWTCGNLKKYVFIADFIRIRPGVYVMNRKFEPSFVNATIDSAWRKHHRSEDIESIHEIFTWEWFFDTDYESYFIPVMCTKEGWTSYMKSRKPHLDLETLVKIWNVLADMEVVGHMHPKDEECRAFVEMLNW